MSPHVVVFSHRRSGTHLTIDAIRNNFPTYRAPFVNMDCLQGDELLEETLETFRSDLESASRVVKSHASASLQTHFMDEDVLGTVRDATRKAKIVYVYRDGRDVMASLYHYVRNVKPELKGTSFHDFLRMKDPIDVRRAHSDLNNVEYWKFHVSSWLKRGGLLPVSFESLLENYNVQIERLSTFLELPAPRNIRSVVRVDTKARTYSSAWVRRRERTTKLWNKIVLGRDLTSVNFREGRAGAYKEMFSRSDLEYFDRIASSLMDELGYTTGSPRI